MTRQQFIEEIKQLSVAERIALIEEISRSLREDIEKTNGDTTAASETIVPAGQSESERKIAAIGQLRGILKTEGPPPSDEEWKEEYVNYLTEKYS